MPLASFRDLLLDARREGYAVCYCESWDLGSFQAVVEAAEECAAPFIAGFNGGFLRHPGRPKPEALKFYAGFRLALERGPVPAAFLLNESDSFEQMAEGIEMGFNAVMPENEGVSADEYRHLVTRVVEHARPRGAAVEAQVGRLAMGGQLEEHPGERTDADTALGFVEETRIDALAVSAGNIHILTKGRAVLDFDVLRRIRERTDIPLVMHGGTSIPPEALATLRELGVAKVNYGTVLKQAYLDALRKALPRYQPPMSPHEFVGMGGERDILVAAREAVRAKVKELLVLSGSAGRAPLPA